MKCPHCHNEVKDEARYCPHCGYHLHEQKPSIPVYRYVIGAVAVVVFIFYTLAMTMLNQYFIKPQISNTIGTTVKGEGTFLKSYTSLDEFNKAFDNADKFISPIKDYNQSLSKTYGLTFTTSYTFRYYSNENLKVKIINKAIINKDVTLEIVREYDRTKTYDEEMLTLSKSGCLLFDDLKMKDLKPYILKMTTKKAYQSLLNAFEEKRTLFENKEGLGHYGVGAYLEGGSLVYYPDGQSYRSVLEIYKNKNYRLAR